MGTVITLDIAADHPAYAGHFPGLPLLPGVVVLDAALRQIASDTDAATPQWQIAAAKFHNPVAPGTALSLQHERLADGSLRFVVSRTGTSEAAAHVVASGLLLPRATAGTPA